MKDTKTLRVFIASPGDVFKERQIVDSVIKEINDVIGYALGLTLKSFRWEDNATPGTGRPQTVIFEQTKPNEWDIFIGILWSRLGTDSGSKDKNLTGTQEEFESAYEEWRKNKKPQIMFYRCMKPTPVSCDASQLQAVQNFFKNFDPDGSYPGLFKPYITHTEFKKLVFRDLFNVVLKISNKVLDDDLAELLNLYDVDTLMQLRDVGLEQVTKTLINTRFEPNSCMSSIRKKLYFCGVSGSKWISTEKSYNNFCEMIERVASNNGEIRFLLISPISNEFKHMIQIVQNQETDKYMEVYHNWLKLSKDYSKFLTIKCFKKLPVFRMQFIDDKQLALSKYHYQADEYYKYDKGWGNPHIIFNSDANFSFYNVFERYYLNEWSKGTDIRKINF